MMSVTPLLWWGIKNNKYLLKKKFTIGMVAVQFFIIWYWYLHQLIWTWPCDVLCYFSLLFNLLDLSNLFSDVISIVHVFVRHVIFVVELILTLISSFSYISVIIITVTCWLWHICILQSLWPNMAVVFYLFNLYWLRSIQTKRLLLKLA